MEKKVVFNELKEIIVDKIGLEPDEITMDSNFRNDLGFDSLDSVEVLMEVEYKFNISIPDEDIENMSLISEAVDLIHSKLN